jgi:dTDP-L-rhamnose 4-epimerase
MTRRALITGGAGFIGSHVADALLERGFEVTVLDRLSAQVHAGTELDADGWPLYLNREARRAPGDLLDEQVLEDALDGVTHLVHLAASVGVGQSMSDIVDYTRNNVMTAATVLERLSRRAHSVERIAVASSMSIYGEGQYRRPSTGESVGPQLRGHEQLAAHRWELEDGGEALEPVATTEAKPLQPASIYAINKRDHEEMFLAVGRALRIPTIALRLFNTYGSRQSLSNAYTGVAAIFASRLLNGRPPVVFEDGGQLRDFVHVQDVAAAFTTVLDSDAPVWDAFNVGSGSPVTVRDIALILAKRLGRSIEPVTLDRYRIGDVRHCFADVGKIERTFGVRPRRRLEDGMAELIEWIGRAGQPVDNFPSVIAELEQHRLVA